MSAGVCGKRLGFEEIFGSSPRTAYSSAKRSRWSSFESPTRPDYSVSILLQMFPSLDSEVVEIVLRNHSNKIEDAIEALRTFSSGDNNPRNESNVLNSTMTGDCSTVSDENEATCSQESQERAKEVMITNSGIDNGNVMEGSQWVDMFVQEMINATDMDDSRRRAAMILEAFEQSVTARTRASEEIEHVTLKERLQSLLNNNQILKRAVAIQHERNLEQDEKAREVQQLKQVLGHYQEQVRNLELSNYTLTLHLQRALENSSIHGKFHPDIL